MRVCEEFYINGEWVKPVNDLKTLDVINPATEEVFGRIALGDKDDVDAAVEAAYTAFESFGYSSVDERVSLLEKILEVYQGKYDEIAETISSEMGAPIGLSKAAQAATGLGHFSTALETLKNYKFEEVKGSALIRKEPIGVVGMITPWNWPINQISCKVGPALAAGCTMVLKPTEIAPFNAILLADVLHEAGVPKGVFNLVTGDGSTGSHLVNHEGVSKIAFTGSTSVGKYIQNATADRDIGLTLELGGKAANIIYNDAAIDQAVEGVVNGIFFNQGHVCCAGSRLLLQEDIHDEFINKLEKRMQTLRVGNPLDKNTDIGAINSKEQLQKIT